MLQKLNERIQGLVAWIIIILVTLTFALFGIDYYMQSHQEASAEVDVNGQRITKQVFELNYRRNRQLRDVDTTVMNENLIKQKLLDEMIINQVSMQAARANGFEVYPEQANSAIVAIPQFQEDGHFSTARYQQALSSALFTPESFQNEVRQGMLLNQQRFAFIGTDFALPGEVKQFVKLYMQTRDYDFVQIPSKQFLKPANVSEDEIKAYYDKHLQAFLSSEQVIVDYVRLTLQDVKAKIDISDEQIRRYYEENQVELGSKKSLAAVKDEIKSQLLADLAQTKYAEILEELADLSYQTPDSLDQVAKTLHLNIEQSEPFSREGGNTVLTKNKQVVQAAFSHDVLTLGNNSEPIQFDKDGVVVLRVHQHIPAKEKPLEEVRDFIAEKLAKEKATLTAMQLGKVLLDGKQTALLQEKLMVDHKLHWHAVVNANRDMDAVPSAINELAFNLAREGAKEGVRLDDGDYVVVRLKKVNNGKLKSVDKEQIASITQQIEANNGVMDYQLYVNDLMSKAHIVKHPD